MIATGVDELAPVTGTRGACAALAVPRASHYRRSQGRRHGPPRPRPAPPRTLSGPERTAVLGELHSERFVDAAPAAVYATLLDEGTYLASERTMYRILAANAEVRERRDQLRHPAYTKPELLATGPRELFSWIAIRLSSATLSRWQGSRSASTPLLALRTGDRHLLPDRRHGHRTERPAPCQGWRPCVLAPPAALTHDDGRNRRRNPHPTPWHG